MTTDSEPELISSSQPHFEADENTQMHPREKSRPWPFPAPAFHSLTWHAERVHGPRTQPRRGAPTPTNNTSKQSLAAAFFSPRPVPPSPSDFFSKFNSAARPLSPISGETCPGGGLWRGASPRSSVAAPAAAQALPRRRGSSPRRAPSWGGSLPRRPRFGTRSPSSAH